MKKIASFFVGLFLIMIVACTSQSNTENKQSNTTESNSTLSNIQASTAETAPVNLDKSNLLFISESESLEPKVFTTVFANYIKGSNELLLVLWDIEVPVGQLLIDESIKEEFVRFHLSLHNERGLIEPGRYVFQHKPPLQLDSEKISTETDVEDNKTKIESNVSDEPPHTDYSKWFNIIMNTPSMHRYYTPTNPPRSYFSLETFEIKDGGLIEGVIEVKDHFGREVRGKIKGTVHLFDE